MFHLATLWLTASTFAGPPDDPVPDEPITPFPPPAAEPTAEEPEMLTGGFDAVLRAAKQRYFSGESGEALALLTGLYERMNAGEDPGDKFMAEAMIYLGEIHLELDQVDRATEAFRFVLERDIDTPISPFHHPIDVVNQFEVVRATVLQESKVVEGPPDPVPLPEPKRPPAYVFAPLGIPQFVQGRLGSGLLFGGLQAGLGIGSIAMYSRLSRYNVTRAEHPRADWDSSQIIGDVGTQRYAIQWPLTLAFYGSWALSIADGNRYFQNRTQLVVTPVGEGSPGFLVVHRF